MEYELVTGRMQVWTAGKPQTLSEKDIVLAEVDITALPDNTDMVYIGDQTVLASSGSESGWGLEPGDILTLENVNLADVWVDALTDDDGITWGGTRVKSTKS